MLPKNLNPFAMVQNRLRHVFPGPAGSYMVTPPLYMAYIVCCLAWFGTACLKWTRRCITFAIKLAITSSYFLGAFLCILEVYYFFQDIHFNGCPNARCLTQLIPQCITDSFAPSPMKSGVHRAHRGL